MSPEVLMVVGLLVTVLLILANAMFVFHEFAFVTIKPAQLRRLAEREANIGQLVAKATKKLDYYIAVDQLGITVTSIAVGWIGQPLVTDLLSRPLASVGILEAATASFVGAGIAFALITASQMIVAELMPKTVALRHPERTAALVALPVDVVALLMHPVVWALNGLGNLTVRLLGFQPEAEGHRRDPCVEELAVMIESSAQAGVLVADPSTLRRALQFSDMSARDVMVPRQDMVALDMKWSVDEVVRVARQARHTRYPVFEGTIDNVVGLLNIKDLVQPGPDGAFEIVFNWRRLIRPIPNIPETASIEQVLLQLRQARQHMAVLIDEFGGTVGLITVANVNGQLVGELDEIQQLGDGQFLLHGHVSIASVEAALRLTLVPAERDYDTIGGLIMARLERIPMVGDRVTVDGSEFTVLSMQGRRVRQVRLRILPMRSEGDGSPEVQKDADEESLDR